MPLHLTRRPGEWIEIGDKITIRIVDIHDGRARIAIVAPRDVPILRGEIGRRGEPTESPDIRPRQAD